MGYPTIEKFDVRFIERTKENVETFKNINKFTHLINSLIGLIFIPNEFHKKGKRTYKTNFLNKPMTHFEILTKIFIGEVTLVDEDGHEFQQKKFFRKDKKGNQKTIDETNVGELVRLFRNGIAHSNIIPVAEGDYWKGIIVKNYETIEKEKLKDHNFETYLNQKELREFSTFIADQYVNDIK